MAADSEAAQQNFEGLYRSWFKAVIDRDLDFFERTLAPDWLYVDVAGATRDKGSYIGYVAELPDGVLLKDAKLRVRLFEPLALVHGRYEIERSVEGLPPRSSTRFTAVWQRVGRSWQALAHQATSILEPGRE
jgi:ketosteroid isomerase-like protein